MDDFILSIGKYKEWLKGRNEPLVSTAEFIAERIERIDSDIHAFAFMDKDAVFKRASILDKSAEKRSLYGVPVALKSNICVEGALTTCCSKMLEGFRPPYNAEVVDNLNKAGAVIFSGLNMDEFAFGSSCETSCYGSTKNPWDLSRIPGGSSGGSAASVAAGEVVCSLGSDTGGSIRQPAAMCGVVGIKPTYGRVSRYGLIAFASSLDQIGTFTRNVTDCAEMLEVISGYDKKDSTSVDIEVPKYTDELSKDIKGLRIGIPEEYFSGGIDDDVKKRIEESIQVFRNLGAEIVEISLPHTKYALSCYYIIGPAEASSNLARYDGAHFGYRAKDTDDMIEMYIKSRSEGFGEEAKRRILLGTYALSSGYYEAYYLKAQKVRTKISEDFKEAFKVCACILTPTAPTTAFKLGERVDDPLTMYLSDVFTIPANLAGLPAISIPCGKCSKGLPVGLQLMAEPFGEPTLIKAAHAFENNTNHFLKTPEGI